MNRIDLVAEQLDPYAPVLRRGGKNLKNIPAHPKSAAMEVGVVTRVLDLDEFSEDRFPPDLNAFLKIQQHAMVDLRRSQTVNAGDRRDDDDVLSLEERSCGRVPHPVDGVIDGGILGDVRIGGRDVGFRLIVIVIADEIFDRVVRKEALKFAIELRRQRFIMHDDQGRLLDPGDHVGESKGFAGTGDAQEDLMRLPSQNAVCQALNGLWLISSGLELRDQPESCHNILSVTQDEWLDERRGADFGTCG